MEVLNIRIKIMKRKNIMLTASIMADTFRYFMRLYPFAFAGKDGNGSGAAIQTTDNA